MSKLKCWRRDTDSNHVWYKKDHSKSVIIPDNNIVLVYDWKKKTNNLIKSSWPFPTKSQAIDEAMKYMKDHDSCKR